MTVTARMAAVLKVRIRQVQHNKYARLQCILHAWSQSDEAGGACVVQMTYAISICDLLHFKFWSKCMPCSVDFLLAVDSTA